MIAGNKHLLLLIACFAGGILNLFAQSNTNATAPRPAQSQRVLFVFETSRGMSRRAENALKVAIDLIRSGVNGQMRAGDELGIWTYNDTLSLGRFPRTKWSPETSQKVASQAGTFLSRQKFEKGADFRQVVPALSKVADGSDYLTIVLISTGETDISGTVFDGRINESYKSWRDEQQKGRRPFVTILRATRGKFASCSVTPSPWQIEIPPWPVEPRIVAAKTNPLPAGTPAPIPASNPLISRDPPGALIFTGKKSKPAVLAVETNVAVASDPVAVVSNPEPTNRSTTPLALNATNSLFSVDAARPSSSNQTIKNPTEPTPPATHAPMPPERTVQVADMTAAAASVPHNLSSRTKLIWIGTSGAAILALAFLFLRRERGSPYPPESLITKSFHRGRK